MPGAVLPRRSSFFFNLLKHTCARVFSLVTLESTHDSKMSRKGHDIDVAQANYYKGLPLFHGPMGHVPIAMSRLLQFSFVFMLEDKFSPNLFFYPKL
jgi:hypothetical protein